jgi:hypothetical protein
MFYHCSIKIKIMPRIIKMNFCFAVLCLSTTLNAQLVKEAVFSAIKGKASRANIIQLPAIVKTVAFAAGDTTDFVIQPYKNGQLIVLFTPGINFIGIARATIKAAAASGKVITTIECTGLSTKGLEGENEAPLSVIADALGYRINIGWNGLANNSLPQLQGEEIPNALFHKAAKGKVEMIPVARYSPDFELPFGYYNIKEAMPALHSVGILSKAGTMPEHQCLFPAIASGSSSFDPGKNNFGFFATGPTHTAYSEDVWNMLLYPANAVHATRIYQLKDKTGRSIPNNYLLSFEEAKNGDYNDYVFIIKNVTPVSKDPFIQLFNGKNLAGWHSFLKDIGINSDPNKNFMVEDSALHVLGKDLGYVITENIFSNYHFKVDFKWGEKKWASRVNEKRDAGVCYNIPANEPDSIWPRSIECQVQEGDVGDFWLLGFSTIKVNGIENKPANHTRMIKQKDAEKPTGEWNTFRDHLL